MEIKSVRTEMIVSVSFQLVTLCFHLQMFCIFFKTAYTTLNKGLFNLYKDLSRIYLTLGSMSKHNLLSELSGNYILDKPVVFSSVYKIGYSLQ